MNQAAVASTQVAHSHPTNVACATTTHQTTVKAKTVVMMVVGTTTTATTRTIIDETTATIAVITRAEIGIAVMAITISAIPSENVICAIASTKEPTIVHPTKAIAVWNMIPPMVPWV